MKKHAITNLLFGLGVCLITLLASVQAYAQSATEIMQRNFQAMRVQDSTGNGSLTLYNAAGDARVRETMSVTKLDKNGKDMKRLIRFTLPADVKGTGLLILEHSGSDDDLWFYLPALRKVKRIVAKEKSNAFMGSEFSYADISDADVDDYKHTLIGTETVGDAKCFHVDSTPASASVKEEEGYSKKAAWIRADNFVAIRVDYYDKDGKLLKTLTATELKEVDTKQHKWACMRREMVNHQTKRRSVLLLKDIKVNTGVSDDTFTTGNLQRGL